MVVTDYHHTICPYRFPFGIIAEFAPVAIGVASFVRAFMRSTCAPTVPRPTEASILKSAYEGDQACLLKAL